MDIHLNNFGSAHSCPSMRLIFQKKYPIGGLIELGATLPNPAWTQLCPIGSNFSTKIEGKSTFRDQTALL